MPGGALAELLLLRQTSLVDTFGGTVSGGVALADTGQTWGVAAGTFAPWSEGGGTATVTPPTAGNTRRSIVTNVYHADGDYFVDFTWASDPVGAAQQAYFIVRGQVSALTSSYRFEVEKSPGTAAVYRMNRFINSASTTIITQANVPGDIVAGTWYTVHIRFTGSLIEVNVWPRGTLEPPMMASATDTTYPTGEYTGMGLVCFAGNTNLPATQYDNINVGAGPRVYYTVAADTGSSVSDTTAEAEVYARAVADTGVAASAAPTGKNNSAEGGANGTAATTGNSGGASGDAFDAIGSVAPSFSTTHVAHGTLAYLYASGGSKDVRYTHTSLADGYGRVCFYQDALAGGLDSLIVGTLASTAVVWTIGIDTSGHVVIQDTGGVSRATSTLTLAAAAYHRLEWHHNSSAQLVVRIYTGVDDSSIAETITASSSTAGNVDITRFGHPNFSNNVWLDDLNAAATAWPGPVGGVSDTVGAVRTPGGTTFNRNVTDTGVAQGVTTYLADTFTRTVGAGSWGTADQGTGWQTPATTPTAFSVNGTTGLIATVASTTYREFAGQSHADAESRFRFSFGVATGGGGSIQLFPALRVQDNTNQIRGSLQLTGGGALGCQCQQNIAGTATSVGAGVQNALAAGNYVANQVWWCAIRLQGQVVDIKIWKDGTGEPAYRAGISAGNYATDTTVGNTGLTGAAAGWTTGDIGFLASTGAGSTSTNITVDDLTVTDPNGAPFDTLTSSRNRALADTGATNTDSAVAGKGYTRTATDTATTASDSVRRIFARAVTDQGVAAAVTNYLTDTFTRTTGAGGWGTADSGTGWATPVTNPTGFSTDGASGLVAYTGGNQYRITAGQSRADVEMRFQFSFPVAQATSASLQILNLVRLQDVNNTLRGQVVLGTAGSLSCQVQQVVASTATNVGIGSVQNALNNGGYVANQVWNCAVRLSGQQFDIKIWKQGTTELDYNMTNVVGSYASDSTTFAGGLTGTAATWTVGDFGIHVSPGAGNPSGTVTIDNVDADSIGQVDTVAAVLTTTRSYSYTPSDTGATITDSVAPLRAWARTASDTATTTTDSLKRLIGHSLTDTGTTTTDTPAPTRAWARAASDTAVTASDTTIVSRNRAAAAADTGTTTTDSTKRIIGRAIADTGTTTSDTLTLKRSWTRAASDTAVTASDSATRSAYTWARATSDTAITPSDTTAIIRNWARPLTDSATSMSDTTRLLVAHAASDTGTTITDTAATLRSRRAADTGTTTTDSVSTVRARVLADTGTTTTDSATRILVAPRATSDTGATNTDTLSRVVARLVSDTATTASDSVARGAYAWQRSASDTAVTLTDSAVGRFTLTRYASDTGVTLTDTVARLVAAVRATSDTATVITDAAASARTRPITDTGTSPGDSVAATKGATRSATDTAFAEQVGDTFTRTVAANGWGADELTGTTYLGPAGTGAYSVDGAQGLIGPLAAGALRRLYLPGTTTADAEAQVDVTFDTVAGAGAITALLYLRLQSNHLNGYNLKLGYETNGNVSLSLQLVNTSTTALTSLFVIAPAAGNPQSTTATWRMRFRAQGSSLMGKAWRPAVDAEPGWRFVVTDTTWASGDDALTGSSGTANTTVAFDNYSVSTDFVAAAPPARSVSDTGAAITDSATRLLRAARALSDTGVVGSDSVTRARVYAETLSDTAVNPSDTTARTMRAQRATADTATTISDTAAVTRQRSRIVADTGTTITDTAARAAALPRAVSDTGVSGSDSTARTVLRAALLSDTATNASDTVVRNAYTWLRTATADTATTISDSVAISSGAHVAVTDTATTISDSVALTSLGKLLTDQGATIVGDHVARTFVRTSITDTAATITDTPRVSVRRVSLTDQGASITDSVAPARRRATADTGATITDTVARAAGRRAADTATTITDLAKPSRGRSLTDQGATLSDSLRKHAYYTTTDIGATISDTLVGGPIRLVDLSDTATTIADSVRRAPSYIIFDTGAVTDEALHRRVWRYILDTGATVSDVAHPPGFVPVPHVGTVATSESAAGSVLVGVSAIYTMSTESRAYAVAATLDTPGAATTDYALVGVTTSEE